MKSRSLSRLGPGGGDVSARGRSVGSVDPAKCDAGVAPASRGRSVAWRSADSDVVAYRSTGVVHTSRWRSVAWPRLTWSGRCVGVACVSLADRTMACMGGLAWILGVPVV